MGMNTTPQLWNASTGKYDQRLTGIGGAAIVTDGAVGIVRNRIVAVTTDTAPVLATSGVATWVTGVRGVAITGVRVVSGTVPLTANVNYRVRYSWDNLNDAEALLSLPLTTNTASATLDIGQVSGFNVTPIVQSAAVDATRLVQVILPSPVYLDISSPIKRLDFVHNIGGSVVLEFVIQAVEVE